MEQQVEKVSFLSEPDSHLLSFFYTLQSCKKFDREVNPVRVTFWEFHYSVLISTKNYQYYVLSSGYPDIKPQFPNVEWTFRKASWLCNMFIWCNFFVLVTLTHLQVAVNQKECPFSRYLPLCVLLLENRYLKQDWVIEELSDKIEQTNNSKEYSCRASTNRVMHGSFLALQVL